MKALLVLAVVGALVARFAASAAAADPVRRPMTVDDMFKFLRVADPQISPDGTKVVYQVGTVDFDANKSSTALWIAATDGSSPPQQLTNPQGKSDRHPRWSPDGKQILFESTRSGTPQLWVISIAGGEARKITSISTGASGPIWAPDGKSVAFASTIYPEYSELPFAESDAKNKERNDAVEKSPVKARTFTRLFYRHWDSYVEDKRQHLFVVNLDGSNCRDVTPGDRDAVPTSSTFSSGDDYTFTPDGKYLVFTAVPAKNESWSTNYDLCRVSVTNKSTDWETLTKSNPAADSGPKFSPDGTKLAWRSQTRAGYEADKWDIKVVSVKPNGEFTGPISVLTEGIDRSANDIVWRTGDAASGLFYSADADGATPYFVTGNEAVNAAMPRAGVIGGLTVSAKGDVIAYTKATLISPPEVYVLRAGDPAPVNISKANQALLDQLDLPEPQTTRIPVEGNVTMQMWLIKPPGFDPKKKWPVAYLVHGGPQGAWENGWSFRWNPSLWAAQGYIVALPNPRGSTGFGQKYVDEIAGDWGGKCYRDLATGIDELAKLPFVDTDRIGSAGGSFGGYMQNWFAVSPLAAKLKCLITHCSVWNFESMWGTTDELWFDEWEHGGLPWEKPGKYAEFSPHKKAGELGKYKTPMLIIHNDLDFRCPIGQGHELFAALQRQGVTSRFVNFPDEGHWVLKPQNSKAWHTEVFGWLKKYVPPGGR